MSETFTCPHCGSVSANKYDIRFRYCGKCHIFVGETDWQELASRTSEDWKEMQKRLLDHLEAGKE